MKSSPNTQHPTPNTQHVVSNRHRLNRFGFLFTLFFILFLSLSNSGICQTGRFLIQNKSSCTLHYEVYLSNESNQSDPLISYSNSVGPIGYIEQSYNYPNYVICKVSVDFPGYPSEYFAGGYDEPCGDDEFAQYGNCFTGYYMSYSSASPTEFSLAIW